MPLQPTRRPPPRRRRLLPPDHRRSPRTALPELFAAVDARAARRLVLVWLDLGVQTHVAVLIGRRRGVLRARRIVNDLVAAEQRVVLTLGPDAATIPTDVVGLLHRREQLERALRRKVSADADSQ